MSVSKEAEHDTNISVCCLEPRERIQVQKIAFRCSSRECEQFPISHVSLGCVYPIFVLPTNLLCSELFQFGVGVSPFFFPNSNNRFKSRKKRTAVAMLWSIFRWASIYFYEFIWSRHMILHITDHPGKEKRWKYRRWMKRRKTHVQTSVTGGENGGGRQEGREETEASCNSRRSQRRSFDPF